MQITTSRPVELTEEQRAAVDAIVGSRRDVQTLGGFAGTGKTTVIRELVARLPGYAVCAYTGKAADVLRRKGMVAGTIHSLIYTPVLDDWGDVEFVLKPPELFEARGIIVDEASMVSRAIYDDLLSLKVPLVFVGDHGQLEPVGGSGFNLMKSPDIMLEKIHRNAGPIARFAEHLRRGGAASEWMAPSDPQLPDPAVCVTTIDQVHNLEITAEWQLVCAYNRTRCFLNRMVRDHLGLPPDLPVVGDRAMCLQNDRKLGLFNSMQGRIGWIDRQRCLMDFRSDQGTKVRVRYRPDAFGSEVKLEWNSEQAPFDWSYCVTCHKMQGDEADNVCVVEQRCGKWDHTRWCYTAASRAKRKLVWIKE